MNFLSRIKAAASLVLKGSIAPFDRLIDVGSYGGDKITKPFAQSVWLMRAIKFCTGPIAAVDLEFYAESATRDEEDETPIEDPLLDAFWARPAQRMSLCDFIEATGLWIKLAGESFWLLSDNAIVPFPEARSQAPDQMILVRPDRMKHVVERSMLVGWVFKDDAGNDHKLLPEQVIHLRNYNPYDNWRGLGEAEVANIAIDTDYLAGKFQQSLMRNNGDRGPYIVAKNGIPDDAQRQQIVNQLREKKELATRGIFKAAFLTADIEVKDPTLTSPDAAWIASRIENRHEIFVAMGVPPSMADVAQSYSIGSASDWYRLINDTCIPLGKKISEGIEEATMRIFKREVCAEFDWDEHPVMLQVRVERAATATAYWNMGAPLSMLNEVLSLGLQEFPGWDQSYLPFSVSPAGSSEMDPASDPSYQEPTAPPDPVQEMRRAIQARSGRSDKWRAHMRSRGATQKKYESAIGKQLFAARAEMLRKLESASAGFSKSVMRGPTAAEIMFSLQAFEKGLIVSLRKVGTEALDVAGQQIYSELGLKDPWKTPDLKALEFVQGRENLIKDASQAIFDQIKASVTESIDQGSSADELANQIRDDFNGISKGRAKTIALTETTAAYSYGRNEAMHKAGVEKKQWLASGLSNVRPTHQDADGQIVPLSEPFLVGDDELMFPGDPNGSPSEVINCHCVTLPIIDEPIGDQPEEE